MSDAPEIRLIETYQNVPIVEVGYGEPVLMTEEAHRLQIRTLLDYPAEERLAIIISYNNISFSKQYGPLEQANFLQSDSCAELRDRVVCLLRYHAQSLTSLVSTMSAHALIQAGASNFAPDLDSAVRAARRAVDQAKEHQSA